MNPEDELSDTQIAEMSDEEIEEMRESLTQTYRDTDHMHHLGQRAQTVIRDKLVRLHKALTNRASVPKRIDR